MLMKHYPSSILSALRLCFSLPACALAINASAETLEERVTALESAQKPQTKKAQANPIRFAGLVQMDYNRYDGALNASNAGELGSNIFVRRVHFRVFHRASDELDYIMLLFANDVTTSLLVGFARYQPNSKTDLRIGKIKEDRSLSMQYIGEEVVAERPMMVNAFALGFQWGVQGHRLFDKGFRLSGGIFKDQRYAGDKDGRDANDKLLLAYSTRGTWSNQQERDVVHLGLSLSQRELGGETFSLGGYAGLKSSTDRMALAPSIESAKHANVAIGEFALQKKAFRLEAEYGVMDVKAAETANHQYSGYYVTASYFPDGNTSRKYNSKYAKFGRATDETNVWETYLRYSVLDLISQGTGSEASVFMLGANYYTNAHLHFQLQAYSAGITGPQAELPPFTDLTGTEYHQGNGIAGRVSYRF